MVAVDRRDVIRGGLLSHQLRIEQIEKRIGADAVLLKPLFLVIQRNRREFTVFFTNLS